MRRHRGEGRGLNDRERVLMMLAQRLIKPDLRGNEYEKKQGFPYADYEKPKKGDLVVCQSSGIHPYSVGFAVSDYEPNTAALRVREIGSGRVCHVSNESFVVIRNIHKDELLEGRQRAFLAKVHKAFMRGDQYCYRYGGLDFDGDTVRIWIREVFGGHLHGTDQESVPFCAEMKWNGRTSIKAILQAMQDAGYGTREFERRPVHKLTGEPSE
ncbi:MAG: hypothetical protein ACYTEX_10995 [Planctomycetota bacterium]|jgi:hypothetical protein